MAQAAAARCLPFLHISTDYVFDGGGTASGAAGGTYHYGGAPAVSWADFARAIFQRADLAVTVEDIPSEAYPTPVRRPQNSRLDCSTLKTDFGIDPPDWSLGLARVIAELKDQGR